MRVETRLIGRLRCHSVGPTTAKLGVFLMHGFGAPGDDLVAVAAELSALNPTLGAAVRWVFPEAPTALPEGGPLSRAWWRIDEARFHAYATGDDAMLAKMRLETPRGMEEARAAVLETLGLLQSESPGTKWVLGGFSQGAMLATDVALRVSPAPAGLMLFSGTLVNGNEWRALAPARSGMPVLQSHGREDTVLPYADAEKLRELLAAGGLPVEFVPFSGGHGLSLDVLAKAAAWLRRVMNP